MKISTASFNSLYKGVVNTIINIMKENNVNVIPMKDNKIFGVRYDDIFINEKGELGYHFMGGKYSIIFNEDRKDWYHAIHVFDLPILLREITLYLNDSITEEI